MYLGKKNFANQLSAFKLLAQGYALEDQDEDTKEFLRKVITEAHNLVTEKINEQDLSFETYDLVTTMVDNDRKYIREYLRQVNPANLKLEDYQTFNNVLASIISDLERK